MIFDEAKLAGMLERFEPGKTRSKDSVFYRAILQNLFFATLNTEMDQRGWRRADQNFMAHSLYRHKECFRDPKAGLEWFKDIPFLNGGLFECLDRDFGLPAATPACAGTADRRAAQAGEGAKPRYLRVDGFSDRDDSRPTVPDFLFFGSEQDVDLSDDYGDKKFRSVRVRGLIDTLNRYKFTIEENTPLDQEVALDPELCGKVFENLLAAYNPETGTTARKATGSFYTPREIVDYMVDESLVAYLKGKMEQGDTGIPACDSSSTSPQTRMSVLPNRGVRALPNLETKFVAANTLIGIDRPAQMMLRNPEIDKKEAELRQVREKHFTARTLKSKAKCREDDKRLRAEIAELLKNDGWDNTTAKQLAAWDPYDQNAHADFFEPEWMFGVKDGFDVVIGNPPYVRPHKLSPEFKRALWDRFETFEKKADLYVCFIERAVRLLQEGGQLAFIVSNGILRLDSFASGMCQTRCGLTGRPLALGRANASSNQKSLFETQGEV